MGLPAERQRLLHRDELQRMVAAGFFQHERVELLRGVLVQMSPQNEPHAAAIQMLNRILVPALLGRADVRVQLPFAASDDSMPEPDLALVEPRYFGDHHPGQAFLIIEVADSSLELDRGDKARLYAESGVPEYWVVSIPDRIVEVFSEPSRGAYLRTTPYRLGETVRPLAFPDVAVPVAPLFGR